MISALRSILGLPSKQLIRRQEVIKEAVVHVYRASAANHNGDREKATEELTKAREVLPKQAVEKLFKEISNFLRHAF